MSLRKKHSQGGASEHHEKTFYVESSVHFYLSLDFMHVNPT